VLLSPRCPTLRRFRGFNATRDSAASEGASAPLLAARAASGPTSSAVLAADASAQRPARCEDVTNGHITFQAIDRVVLENRRS